MKKKVHPAYYLGGLAILLFFALRSFHEVFSLTLFNDEWLQLGSVWVKGFGASIQGISPFDLALGKIRVLGTFLNNLFLLKFDNPVFPIMVFGLLFHFLNGFLMYRVAKKISKNEAYSIIAAVLFTFSSLYSQVFYWPAATVQSIGSLSFMLLSFIFVLRFSESGMKKNIGISLLFLYVGFLIKDSIIFFLLFLPILLYILKRDRKEKFHLSWKVILGVLVFFVIGLYKVITYFRISSDQLLNVGAYKGVTLAIINALIYPFVTISHFLIPFDFMMKISATLSNYYSFLQKRPFTDVSLALLRETVFIDEISIIVSTLVIVVIIVAFKAEKTVRSPILIGSSYFFLSFIPIALFLNERNTSFVESRYLYSSVPGIALVLSAVFMYFWKKTIYVKKKYIRGSWIVIALLLLFLYKQTTVTERLIHGKRLESEDIRSTLNQIRTLRSYIEDKTIFYVTGDTTFFAGNPLPFQIGSGYMLMILYFQGGRIPASFIVEPYGSTNYYPFLFPYEGQGYQEKEGKGFGYFKDLGSLCALYRNNTELSSDHIVGLRYTGKDKKLIDITEEVKLFINENCKGISL